MPSTESQMLAVGRDDSRRAAPTINRRGKWRCVPMGRPYPMGVTHFGVGGVEIVAVDGRFGADRNKARGVARSGGQVWTSSDGRLWSRRPILPSVGDPVTLVRVQQGSAGMPAMADNEPDGVGRLDRF